MHSCEQQGKEEISACCKQSMLAHQVLKWCLVPTQGPRTTVQLLFLSLITCSHVCGDERRGDLFSIAVGPGLSLTC